MAVGIKVGSIIAEIGAPSFLHAFFSTVSVHCELEGWGSRFPCLMNQLYRGRLLAENVEAALKELREVKVALSQLPPSAVVWDIEDRSVQPPWGDDIATSITNLGNYFLSSRGRDLFALLEEMLSHAAKKNKDVSIVSF